MTDLDLMRALFNQAWPWLFWGFLALGFLILLMRRNPRSRTDVLYGLIIGLGSTLIVWALLNLVFVP